MKLFKSFLTFLKGKDKQLSDSMKKTPEYYLGVLQKRKEKLDRLEFQRDQIAGKLKTQRDLEVVVNKKIKALRKAAVYAKNNEKSYESKDEYDSIMKGLFNSITIKENELKSIAQRISMLDPIYINLNNVVDDGKRVYMVDKQKIDSVIEKIKFNKEISGLIGDTALEGINLDELKDIELEIENDYNTANIRFDNIMKEKEAENIDEKIIQEQSFEDWMNNIK